MTWLTSVLLLKGGEFSSVLNVFAGSAGLSWKKPVCLDQVSAALPLLCKIFSLLPLDGSTNSTEH